MECKHARVISEYTLISRSKLLTIPISGSARDLGLEENRVRFDLELSVNPICVTVLLQRENG